MDLELRPETATMLVEHDRRVLVEQQPCSFEEIRTADGQTRTWLSFKFPLPNGNEEPLVGGVAIDITERKFYEDQLAEYQLGLEESVSRLEEPPTTDSLTSLRNKRAIEQTLVEQVRAGAPLPTPLSLIMVDVDYFKKYNDAEGPAAGDDVLRMVAKVLGENIRPHDFLVRYGGEEFVIILGSTPVRGAYSLAEHLRRALRGRPLAPKGHSELRSRRADLRNAGWRGALPHRRHPLRVQGQGVGTASPVGPRRSARPRYTP